MDGTVVALDKNKFNDYIRTFVLLEEWSRYLSIDNINIFYKMNVFLKTQKKHEKYKLKIFHVFNSHHQILMNEKRNLTGDDRRYFCSPFYNWFNLDCICCYDKGTTLYAINDQKNILEARLNEFDAGTQFLTEDNFAKAILVKFETIREKENYYNQFPFFLWIYNTFFSSLEYYFCCCYSTTNRVFRAIVVFIISFILICMVFGVVFGLTFL